MNRGDTGYKEILSKQIGLYSQGQGSKLQDVSLGQTPLLPMTGWWRLARLWPKRNVCQHSQLKKTVPIEIYNPCNETIQLQRAQG